MRGNDAGLGRPESETTLEGVPGGPWVKRSATRHGGSEGSMRLVVVTMTAAMVLSACSSDAVDTGAQSPRAEPDGQLSMMEIADPVPTGLTEVGRVDPDGGSAAESGVSVQAAAGAVATGDSAVVSIGQAPGEVGGERWGVPVEVVHEQPLSAPLTVTWELDGVQDPDRSGLMLVRWNPSISAWVTQDVPYEVEGGTLSAQISEFSIWDWVANAVGDVPAGLGQEVGEIAGSRVDEPTCEGDLPGWVRQAISPSEDLEAAAIGVCFEPDKDEVVTVRVSNNRTFTQVMGMTQGGQGWAWTWGGQEWVGIDQAAYGTARLVFDSDTHHLLPPLHEVAVGIARPEGGGQPRISAEATVSTASVATDVVAYTLDQIPIGGLSNPVLNAAVQGTYACFGKQALGGGFSSTDGLLRAVVDGLAGCADQAFRIGGSDFSDVVIDGMDEAKYVRTAQYFRGALRTLKVAEIAFYLSDQLANAAR